MMKFVVFFIVCCAALVAAEDEEIMPTQEDVKQYIETTVEEFKITCENHKEICYELADKYGPDPALKNDDAEACISVVKLYLCDGIRETGDFTDVYNQFIAALRKLDELHNSE